MLSGMHTITATRWKRSSYQISIVYYKYRYFSTKIWRATDTVFFIIYSVFHSFYSFCSFPLKTTNRKRKKKRNWCVDIQIRFVCIIYFPPMNLFSRFESFNYNIDFLIIVYYRWYSSNLIETKGNVVFNNLL